MDLCLMIEGQEGVTWPQWRALAASCEQHGIGTLFRSDHYMNLDGQHLERGSLDAWGTLNALAAITSRLRLGTMVSPTTFRHPSELAKLVATADHVSGGRIELGLGAGWHDREHAAYGFPFPPTRKRMDMLEEQLQIVLGAWTESSAIRASAEPHSDEFKACVTLQCDYTLDTWGKFPGTVPSVWIMNFLQAQHLDLDFYDRFFKPGAYLHTHATHMNKWHG